MPTLNHHDLPWRETRSPKGRFHLYQKDLSLALGGVKDVGTWGGGHPFDVALVRVPPAASNWPQHVHTTQWEFFMVQAGTGTLTLDGAPHPVREGDCYVVPPGRAHQLTNTGESDLLVLVVANQPESDAIHYPDSGKWFLKPQRQVFTMQPAAYYDGEE